MVLPPFPRGVRCAAAESPIGANLAKLIRPSQPFVTTRAPANRKFPFGAVRDRVGACPLGGTGRRNGLKIRWPFGRAGSSPAAGTK